MTRRPDQVGVVAKFLRKELGEGPVLGLYPASRLLPERQGCSVRIFAYACRLGAEGIVSKDREHPYRSGPSKAWLKIKNPPLRLPRRDSRKGCSFMPCIRI
jgi:hypothetical protein